MKSIANTIRALRDRVLNALPHRWAGRLRSWKMRRRLKYFHPRWVAHQYAGETFKIRIEDDLGKGWYDNDWDELPEVAYLTAHKLKPGALVFDLGAHQCVVAMMLASKVEPNGQVIAVEPSHHNARLGRMNIARNLVLNVKLIEAAISDKVGTIFLNEGLNAQLDDGTAAWGQTPVHSLTIDQLANDFGMPDVVFVDIEGAECLALEGASNVLQKKADFFIEVHVACGLELLSGSVERILSYFRADQFELLVRNDSQPNFRPIQSDDPFLKARFYLLALSK